MAEHSCKLKELFLKQTEEIAFHNQLDIK